MHFLTLEGQLDSGERNIYSSELHSFYPILWYFGHMCFSMTYHFAEECKNHCAASHWSCYSLSSGYVCACKHCGWKWIEKEAVMNVLLPHRVDHIKPSFVVNFLQSKDKQLRVATLWCLLNLIYPKCETSSGRVIRLQNAGVILQVKSMINDPCLDCKVLPS